MSTDPSLKKAGQRKRFTVYGVACTVLLCAATFVAGWFLRPAAVPPMTPQPLRATGYQFISPLITCNFNALKVTPESKGISNDIQAVIQKHEAAGDISKASTYFGDFKTSAWSGTYGTETFYPSSITKIPIMMAYYALAESTSSILDAPITYPVGSTDLNNTQETKPAIALVPGQTYTVNELIEHMIKYSDNNAAALLFNALDPGTVLNIYNELQIPINNNPTVDNLDFVSAQQLTLLFRVLYNSTYLSRDDSENALRLLSETSFTDGIVAGVPSSTTVSHKFGIVGITQNGIPAERELHDCGIVYAPNHPYVVCIMTRGSSNLQTMENTIADVSRTIYRDVENGKE